MNSLHHPALALRDALVPLIQLDGRNPLPSPWDVWLPLRELEILGSTLVLLGPCATPPEGKASFMLEVHHAGQEVFCLKWDEDETGEVLTHAHGEWESNFLFWADHVAEEGVLQ